MAEGLKLNKLTGYYETVVVISIEPEIVNRALQQYIAEHNVDITDPEAMTAAVKEVTKLSKWADHPRARKIIDAVKPVVQKVEQAIEDKPVFNLPESMTPSEEEIKVLEELAATTSEDEWESLLWPLITGVEKGTFKEEREMVYKRRNYEREVLNRFRVKRNNGASPATLKAVADAVNGVRIL